MTLTLEKAEQVGEALKLLVIASNSIKEEDLEELLNVGRKKEALDPLIDPTRWMYEGEANRLTSKVLMALLTFKRAVKGIGNFR